MELNHSALEVQSGLVALFVMRPTLNLLSLLVAKRNNESEPSNFTLQALTLSQALMLSREKPLEAQIEFCQLTRAGETKRQNFNVTPEQEAQIEWLRSAIGAASAKETILRAVSVLSAFKEYTQKGFKLALLKPDEQVELVIPGLQPPTGAQWKYLVERPHPWRRQLYVKGRRLLASTVWQDMLANELSLDETAENFSLPINAVVEIVRYCETDRELLKMEADEEHCRLEEKGVTIEPTPAR